MELLETSIKALEIAKLAADKTPIPGLSTAVDCALSIAKKAKDIKDTRDDCRALAERVAALVLAVYQQLKDGSSDTGLKEYVTMFLMNLQDIENLMDRRLRPRTRDRIRFVFSRDKLANEVKVLTTKLEDSFRTFMIRAALTIDDSMNTLTSGNLRLMQHIDDSARAREIVVRDTGDIRTGLSDLAQRVRGSAAFDGNFRLFAHENLVYLEPIIDSGKLHHMATQHGDERTSVQAVAQSQTGRVFRYRAIVEAAGDLTGTQVVVYEYPDLDSQQFVEVVNLAKQTRRHPNLLAMLGYSRPGDPGQATYIVMEDCIPFAEHLSSFLGSSKLRIYLQVVAEIYVAINHVETQVELRRLLPMHSHWDLSATSHPIRSDEVVFDHRHGGRLKWARDPFGLEKRDNPQIIDVPAARGDRMRTIADLRAIACAQVDALVQHWLSRILRPIGVYGDLLLGRSWWPIWEHITDCSRYPLEVWLGRNSCNEYWTCLSAQDPGFKVNVTMQSVPYVFPGPGQSRDFWQRFHMAEYFNIPDSDFGEMCIEFNLNTGDGQTRWKRYQFSSIPVNTTLLFRQHLCALDGLDAASWMMRALPDSYVLGHYACIGIARYREYYTETTITTSTHATEQVYPPFWFFLLQFNGGDGSAHNCNIPTGFWSSEKYPTSLPAGIIFESIPQFEPIHEGMEAPLFTSTQMLGDLVFTAQTKRYTDILQLNEDELVAFRESQESHHSTSDTNAGDSDHSSGDSVATDGSDEDGARHSDAESLVSSSRSEDYVQGVNYESPESDYQDATDAGYDSAEEYYSAEEDEATGLACGECPS